MLLGSKFAELHIYGQRDEIPKFERFGLKMAWSGKPLIGRSQRPGLKAHGTYTSYQCSYS